MNTVTSEEEEFCVGVEERKRGTERESHSEERERASERATKKSKKNNNYNNINEFTIIYKQIQNTKIKIILFLNKYSLSTI